MNTNKNATRGGGVQTSKKLLAALAVMAVAFVVLAAVPSVATDSDADATTPVYKDGIIAAGNIHDQSTANQIISALSGKTITDSAVDTVFIIYKATVSEEEVKAIVSGTVEGKAFGGDDSATVVCKNGVNVVYWTIGGDGTKAGQVNGFTDASKPAEVTLKVGDTTYDKITIDAGSVTLYQDVTNSIDYTVTVVGDVTLDLNDHELKLNQNAKNPKDQRYIVATFSVADNSSLKIVGSDKTKSLLNISGYEDNIAAYATISAVISASTGAKVTMNAVGYTTHGSAFFPCGDAAEVNINDSAVTAGTYAVGTNAAVSKDQKITITISESVLTTTDSDSATVMVNVDGAKLNIMKSVLNGHRQAVFVRAGAAELTGVTINYDNSWAPANQETDNERLTVWKSGNEGIAAAITVGNICDKDSYAGAASLIMTGGSINADSGRAVATTVYSEKAGTTVDIVIGNGTPTTINCGPKDSAATVTVSDLRYSATNGKNPTTPLMISTGSVKLGGTLDEVKIVDGEATVSSDLTIADGGRLVLAEGATVTVKEGAKIVLNDADDLVIDENAKLVLEEDAQIMKGTATVYIPGTINRVGGTEYVVNVATFDGKYTVYYGVATQPMAYTGKEIKDGDVVGSATILQCLKKDGTDLTTGTSIDVANIVINDSVSGKVLTPETYPGAVTFTVTIKIQDTKGNSYVNKTDADILVTKADLSKATATIEPLTYDGTDQTPEYSLTFNGEAVGEIAVKYYTDKSCTTEVMVRNAGTYYARFTATADNELFAGEKVVEFKVEKAASGAFGYDVAKTDGEAGYYWTAHAYDGNVIVDINDASGTYKLYIATALKADGTPDYGASATFADQTAFDDAIKAIDSVQSAAYTIYLKVEVSGATNYKDETIVIDPISVGDVAFKITVSKAGNGTVGAPKYCQAGTEVVLVVTPSEGWKLDGDITVNYALGTTTINEKVVDNRFIMPAANVELKVVFVQQYTVEFADGVDVEAERTGEVVSKETYVDAGERITVSVPAGMRFDGEPVVKYTVSGTEETADLTLSDGAYTFVMPAADVKITFKLVGDLKVVLVEDGYKDLVFEGLADGEMFDLPFPADHDFWTVGEDVEKYNGGSIYVVDKDHAEDGVITFTATDAPEDPVIEYVTVTFVYGLKGEHTYSLDVVKDGAIGIFPAAAVIDGYTLSWTSNGAPVSETDVATEDMIVVASYEAIPPVELGEEIVKVTFRYGEDTTIVEIKKGTAVGMTPADAVKDGYTLKWMVGEVEFNIMDQISEDTVVNAVYTPIVEPEVQYSTNMVVALKVVDGKIYYTIVALDGKVVPAGTMKIEYQFFDGFSYDKETLGTVEISGGSSVIVGTMNIPTDKTISKFFAEFSFGENAESAILFV